MATQHTISSDQSLADVLTNAAKRHPARTAVRLNRHSVSYQQLDQLADQICVALIEAGVAQGDRIGVLGLKSPQMVAATQAVLRAGAVYVPIAPRSSPSQAFRIFKDCGTKLVIGDGTLTQYREALRRAGCQTLHLDDPLPTVRHKIRRQSQGDQLAYLLYTSGPRGQPKGVMGTHRSALTCAAGHRASAC